MTNARFIAELAVVALVSWCLGFWSCLWVVYKRGLADEDSDLDTEFDEFAGSGPLPEEDKAFVKRSPVRMNDTGLGTELHKSNESVKKLETGV